VGSGDRPSYEIMTCSRLSRSISRSLSSHHPKPLHSTRLVSRQSAMEVSSIHWPARRWKGPPPIISLSGSKPPRGRNSTECRQHPRQQGQGDNHGNVPVGQSVFSPGGYRTVNWSRGAAALIHFVYLVYSVCSVYFVYLFRLVYLVCFVHARFSWGFGLRGILAPSLGRPQLGFGQTRYDQNWVISRRHLVYMDEKRHHHDQAPQSHQENAQTHSHSCPFKSQGLPEEQ
jgi:hypothetical protein